MAARGVFIAVSSPLVRMRVRHALLGDDRLQITHEAFDVDQVVQAFAVQLPSLIVADERLIRQLLTLRELQPRRGVVLPRVVLIAGNSHTTEWAHFPIVRDIVPIDMPAGELRACLLREPDPEPVTPPATPVRGLEHRFSLGDQNDQPQQAGPTPGSSGLPENALDLNRRQQHGSYERLARILAAMQTDQMASMRDQETGLPNSRGLGLALRSLPSVDEPAAVLVIDLWHRTPAIEQPTALQQHVFLRHLGALLRATMRQDDLVARIDGMTFAVVLPGLTEASTAIPIDRLRRALAALSLPGSAGGAEPAVALGIGFWRSGISPSEPLDCAWREMLAERERNASLAQRS